MNTMKAKTIIKRIRVTKQSIEEIRQDNKEYFEALASRLGEAAARTAEQEYLEQVKRELESVADGEFAEVSIVQINGEIG